MHNFLYQTKFTYYLDIVPKTTYYSSDPNLCHYPSTNSFIYDLLYASGINPILQSNLNYKKLLKCDNFTNFLCTNLNYKKLKLLKSSTLIIFYTLLLSFHNFSSFVIHLSHTLVGCHAIGTNSLSVLFLHALHCLNQLNQVISLTRTLLVSSSSSKLLSSKLKESQNYNSKLFLCPSQK